MSATLSEQSNNLTIGDAVSRNKRGQTHDTLQSSALPKHVHLFHSLLNGYLHINPLERGYSQKDVKVEQTTPVVAIRSHIQWYLRYVHLNQRSTNNSESARMGGLFWFCPSKLYALNCFLE